MKILNLICFWAYRISGSCLNKISAKEKGNKPWLEKYCQNYEYTKGSYNNNQKQKRTINQNQKMFRTLCLSKTNILCSRIWHEPILYEKIRSTRIINFAWLTCCVSRSYGLMLASWVKNKTICIINQSKHNYKNLKSL